MLNDSFVFFRHCIKLVMLMENLYFQITLHFSSQGILRNTKCSPLMVLGLVFNVGKTF